MENPRTNTAAVEATRETTEEVTKADTKVVPNKDSDEEVTRTTSHKAEAEEEDDRCTSRTNRGSLTDHHLRTGQAGTRETGPPGTNGPIFLAGKRTWQ